MINATTTCTFGNPLIIEKTGADVYLTFPTATNQNFQFGTSTCVTVKDPETVIVTLATSTATNTPQYINGFSYGEIITGFFLLILVTMHFFGGITNRLHGTKQKLGYKIKL